MNRVIARCPNCGVEHDDAHGGACEVCGTTLRFWCRVHGAAIGWLDSAECPRCAAELVEARRPPPAPRYTPPAPAPRRRRTRARVERPPEPASPRRDHAEILRESAEDLRPYVTTGAGVAFRLIRALFAVIRYALVGAVLGALGGAGVAYTQRGDLVWPVISGALIGGGVGLLLGLIVALRILLSGPRRVR